MSIVYFQRSAIICYLACGVKCAKHYPLPWVNCQCNPTPGQRGMKRRKGQLDRLWSGAEAATEITSKADAPMGSQLPWSTPSASVLTAILVGGLGTFFFKVRDWQCMAQDSTRILSVLATRFHTGNCD